MKKLAFYSVVFLLFVLPLSKASAQLGVAEAIAQGIRKVIRAVDLKIQRLQNETIWLQNAQKTLENAMSKLRLDEITDWVERQRKLYGDYFEELWQIKSTISYYHRIREVIDKQKQLVQEYQRVRKLVGQDKNFTDKEIDYMYRVYAGILGESIKNLDQLFLVASAFTTQMSDAKRLEIINAVADSIDRNLDDLRQFNTQNMMISMQRAKDRKEIEVTKKLYGLQ